MSQQIEATQTHLNTEVAAVHVVAEEQVTRGGRRPAHLEQLHQVEELPVDVPAHWGGQTETDAAFQFTLSRRVHPRRLTVGTFFRSENNVYLVFPFYFSLSSNHKGFFFILFGDSFGDELLFT